MQIQLQRSFLNILLFFVTLLIGGISSVRAEKPLTSNSYLQVVQCQPQLKNYLNPQKIELKLLKEKLDQLWPSVREEILQKNIEYTTKEGQLWRLRWMLQPVAVKTKNNIYNLHLEKIDSRRVATIEHSAQVKHTLTHSGIAKNWIQGQTIVSESQTGLSHKTQQTFLKWRMEESQWVEIEFDDTKQRKKLLCFLQKDLGTVCTCSKLSL